MQNKTESPKSSIKDKSGLARLMAIENLQVLHNPRATTACFDVKNRILTLPILEDMSNFTYDAFIAHEVGHALYTPYSEDQYNKIFSEIPPMFLNITEDARIERMIKRKYPGTTKDFYQFYKKYSSEPLDFFGLKDNPIEKRGLIDRINLHFKIGPFYKIPFSQEEQQFVKMVEDEVTFEDAVASAKAIYEYMKQKGYIREIEEEDDNEEQEGDGQESEDGEGDGEEQSGSSGNSGSGASKDDPMTIVKRKKKKYVEKEEDSSDEEGKQSKESKNPGNKPGKTKKIDLGDAGSTQKTFSENLEKIFQAANKDLSFGDIMKVPSYKRYITDIHHSKYTNISEHNKIQYNNFVKKITPTVNMMVAQFNLRKSAKDYHKNSTAKSGELNLDEISGYKFSEDIFLKNEIIFDSKNHGIVMMLDWSGSMSDNISSTVKQLIVLTEFCRKVQIPFEVYSFTTKENTHNYSRSMTPPPGQIMADMNIILTRLFSSADRFDVFRQKSALIFASSKHQQVGLGNMGGTPISSLAFLSEYIVRDFKVKHKREKTVFVILSDGDTTDAVYEGDTSLAYTKKIIIRDPSTGINYTHDNLKDGPIYNTLFKYVREKCKIDNMIGFYITPIIHKGICSAISPHEYDTINEQKMVSEFNAQKYYQFKNGIGFDSFYAVSIKNFDISTTDRSDDLKVSTFSSEKTKKERIADYLKRSTKTLIFMDKFVKDIS